MNRVRILPILILFTYMFIGCGPKEAAINQNSLKDILSGRNAARKLSVVATNFPAFDFTREIAGEVVDLVMLLPPGTESHSFEPTPQDIIKIQNCGLFIYAGGESDEWIRGILESMDTRGMRIVALMDLVEVFEEEIVEGMEEEEEDEFILSIQEDGEAEEAEYDEHVWTSPVNAQRIVLALSQALQEVDKVNAGLYAERAAAYAAKLEGLDAAFREAVRDAKRRTIVFGDRFPFRYLAEEYGLSYYAAFPGCSTETEPSAATVAFLIDKVRQEKIPVIFHIELSNERMADTIAEETGAQKRLLHACHNVSKAEFESSRSYLELQTANAATLKEALH